MQAAHFFQPFYLSSAAATICDMHKYKMKLWYEKKDICIMVGVPFQLVKEKGIIKT